MRDLIMGYSLGVLEPRYVTSFPNLPLTESKLLSLQQTYPEIVCKKHAQDINLLLNPEDRKFPSSFYWQCTIPYRLRGQVYTFMTGQPVPYFPPSPISTPPTVPTIPTTPTTPTIPTTPTTPTYEILGVKITKQMIVWGAVGIGALIMLSAFRRK